MENEANLTMNQRLHKWWKMKLSNLFGAHHDPRSALSTAHAAQLPGRASSLNVDAYFKYKDEMRAIDSEPHSAYKRWFGVY